MDVDAIDAQFDGVRDRLITQTQKARRFPTAAEAALDLHEWLYYGSDQTPMVSRINPDRGTNLAYVFVTLCIVSPAARFTLASEYVSQWLGWQFHVSRYPRGARSRRGVR